MMNSILADRMNDDLLALGYEYRSSFEMSAISCVPCTYLEANCTTHKKVKMKFYFTMVSTGLC